MTINRIYPFSVMALMFEIAVLLVGFATSLVFGFWVQTRFEDMFVSLIAVIAGFVLTKFVVSISVAGLTFAGLIRSTEKQD